MDQFLVNQFLAVNPHPVIPTLLHWKIPTHNPESAKLRFEFNVYFSFVIQSSFKMAFSNILR